MMLWRSLKICTVQEGFAFLDDFRVPISLGDFYGGNPLTLYPLKYLIFSMVRDVTRRSKFLAASRTPKTHKIAPSREPHMLVKQFWYQNLQKPYISIT